VTDLRFISMFKVALEEPGCVRVVQPNRYERISHIAYDEHGQRWGLIVKVERDKAPVVLGWKAMAPVAILEGVWEPTTVPKETL
jgi:hypothetical protein